MTRRDLLGLAGGMLLSPGTVRGAMTLQPDTTAGDVDHLMWGARDLDAGLSFIEARTGVRAAFGGVHPNRGTRNALLSFGPGRYLEIISLDPAQPGVKSEWAARLEGLPSPRMITWAAAVRGIEALDTKLRAGGFETSGVIPGSRAKPDGSVLKWKALSVGGHGGDVVPFLIEWDPASKHPSTDSPSGCTLQGLRLEHPDADKMNRLLEAMGLRIRVRQGAQAKLSAWLSTPKGALELL